MSSNTIYHIHHIIPRHMGGSDDPSNLVTLTVEEHAEAHRKLYEEYGRWQDKVAWKGLAGLMSTDECLAESYRLGGLKGAIKKNGGLLYTNGKDVKKFMPCDAPNGWHRLEHRQVETPRRKIKTPDGIFENMADAARYYGVSRQAIHKKVKKEHRPDWTYVL